MHESIFAVVSVGTNGSNLAFNEVIWLSFLFQVVDCCLNISVYNLAGFFMCLITFVLWNTDPTQREGICLFGDQH